MTDLVERLRDFALSDDGAIDPTPLVREAADEIERLEAGIVGADRLIKAAHGDCDRLREFNTKLCDEVEKLRKDIVVQMQERAAAADKIERLEARIEELLDANGYTALALAKAEDKIERLREENKKLWEALDAMVNPKPDSNISMRGTVQK